MEVAERIRAHSAQLTAAERRVAEVVLERPQSVGFGTVADLARSADVGAASVVRLASKLGFDGYTELHVAIQQELTLQLRPAVERIGDDLGTRADHVSAELSNIRSTLTGVDDRALGDLVDRLADVRHPAVVVSGEASRGVAQQFVAQLHQLRGGVSLFSGNEVAVRRDLAVLPVETTAIVVDLRRYERWVLDAHTAIFERDIWSAGVTDSVLSPIASRADVAFVVGAKSIGPFDSYVGALALFNLVALDVAAKLRDPAAARLAAIESAWTEHGSLTDSPD